MNRARAPRLALALLAFAAVVFLAVETAFRCWSATHGT